MGGGGSAAGGGGDGSWGQASTSRRTRWLTEWGSGFPLAEYLGDKEPQGQTRRQDPGSLNQGWDSKDSPCD